jgi:cysteine desulfurase
MSRPIYLDNHATTRCDPRVVNAMLPYFGDIFGNPASQTHQFGRDAERAVDEARERIADVIGASAREIVFTSGATEAVNLAISGLVGHALKDAGGTTRPHIVTLVTEHKAVLDTCRIWERSGVDVTYLPVDEAGIVTVDAVSEAIDSSTVLVSVMHANNEIGVLQPIDEIGAMCRERKVCFHTDAAQSVGKVSFDVESLQVDMASMSAHKIYGPKGIGALYVRRRRPRIQLDAQIHGGGHERGRRSGTLAVPLIVGFAEALSIAAAQREQEAERALALRKRLHEGLSAGLSNVHVNGCLDRRLPGNLNMSFGYVESESLLMGIDNIAVSTGSACTSDTLEPSYVLQAIGVPDELAHSSIRFGIGRFNTQDEIDETIKRFIETVGRLRALSPSWKMVEDSNRS